MKWNIRSGSAAMLAAVSLATSVGLAGAETTKANTPPNPEGKYCSILVGKAVGDGVSPVLAKSCSNKSIDEAAAATETTARKLKAQKGDVSAQTTALVQTQLMGWFQHADFNLYQSGSVTAIYGYDGPCDYAGYRVEPQPWWKDNLSSIKGYNSCYVARVSNKALSNAGIFNVSGTNGNYLGVFNDNVGLVQVWKG